MSHLVVLVWLGTAAARAAHEPDLASWAASRGVALEDPSPDSALPPAAHDDAVAASVEALLGEARSALFGSEPERVDTALGKAEAALRAHPELPECAWLLAEVHRTRAALLGVTDPGAAERHRAAARALDGELAAPFGAATPQTPPPEFPGSPLLGPEKGDRVYIDGELAPDGAGPLVRAGEHHVRVLRRDGLAWAGFVNGGAPVTIAVPRAAACSIGDLGGVASGSAGVAPGAAVACPNWIAAREDANGRIAVARCRESKCGSFLPWSRAWGRTVEGPAQPAWPVKPEPFAFWPWLVGGVVVVAGTGAALYAAGAFEREGPPERRLEFVPPER